MSEPFPGTPPSAEAAGTLPSARACEDRLDSWKEIAAYLKRDVTTAQRWEKREGMPVRRHLHDRMGSVYASRAELDAWAHGRNLRAAQENGNNATPPDSPAPPPPRCDIDFPNQMEVCLAAGSGGNRAGDWRKPLVSGYGALLAKPNR